MKRLTHPATLPPMLVALDRALSTGPCALDGDVPVALWRRALSGPASEFLSRPGKELRTSIVRAGWMLGGGDPEGPFRAIALVIEILHAGSLIIDDVEDGSTERRGAPALHELVGVPLAINTGSWMYFWALAELAELALPPSTQLAAQRATIATLVRCHHGQALDLGVRISDVDVRDAPGVVAATTRLKTGALCRLAAELGALAAGADPERCAAIATFGEAAGIGLQMLDDLGSLTSPERRRKGREDLTAGRPTWPWAWLAAHNPFAWSRLVEQAKGVSAGTGDVDTLVDALVAEVGAVGRLQTRAALDAALAELVASVGRSPVTDGIADYLDRMEQSYG